MKFIETIKAKSYNINTSKLFLASFFFSLMTVCVKLVDSKISIYQLVFFRSIFSLSITTLILSKKGINQWGANKPLLILRGLLGTIALLCIFYAIRTMPLSISTVIQYTYPIFISIFASILIKERLTRNVIIALFLGWLGIFLIINPYQTTPINLEINNFSILIAFIGAISTALAYVTVKKLSIKEDIFVIIKYFPLVSLIILTPIVLNNWTTPELFDLILIFGIGIFTQAGQTFLTIGLKNLPASQASSINYMQVLFAYIWGIFIFNEDISFNFIAGATLVLLGIIFSTRKFTKKIYNK